MGAWKIATSGLMAGMRTMGSGASASGLSEDPVVAMPQDVGADQAPHRHEGRSLLRRHEAGVDRRAGRIADPDSARLHGFVEARRAACLAERHRARLDGPDEAGADELVDLEAAGRNANEMQAARPPFDDGPRQGHRDAGVVGRQRHAHAGLDQIRQRGKIGRQSRLLHRRTFEIGRSCAALPFARHSDAASPQRKEILPRRGSMAPIDRGVGRSRPAEWAPRP
jgi:hypothetical protein